MTDSDITSNFVMLLRKMGHDMRVPLNTLISTTDMLMQGAYDPLTPKQEKAATRLQRNSYRLLATVDDFVTYIKADAGDLIVSHTNFDIQEKLELWSTPIRPMMAEKGITLTIAVPATSKIIWGDETLLKRMIQALLWNAISFTTQGSIDLTVEARDDAKWMIRVKDTGSGIPSDDIPHIFEPFWRGEGRPQVPTAGAGLGLPLARALARIMKGDLSLQETSPSGTCFCIELPIISP
jgi:signal transduction histidine kinase